MTDFAVIADVSGTTSDWAVAFMVVGVAICAMIVLVVYILKTGRFPWDNEK